MDNPEKLAKTKKNRTQYALDTTIHIIEYLEINIFASNMQKYLEHIKSQGQN